MNMYILYIVLLELCFENRVHAQREKSNNKKKKRKMERNISSM